MLSFVSAVTGAANVHATLRRSIGGGGSPKKFRFFCLNVFSSPEYLESDCFYRIQKSCVIFGILEQIELKIAKIGARKEPKS